MTVPHAGSALLAGSPSTSQFGKWALHDGDFVPASQISLPPSTQALNYGTGVFEGIRAYSDARTGELALFRLAEHFERFACGARLLRIDLGLSVEKLGERTVELVRRNHDGGDVYVRPLAYKLALGPETRFGVRLTGVSSMVTINTMTMGRYAPSGELRLAVSAWRRIPAAALPASAKITGMYANSALAVDDALAAGLDDAIMLTVDGHVAEASTANVFVINGSEIATPAASSDILAGITRASVIEIARRKFGMRVTERDVSRAELHSADEVFVSGTGVEVVAVVEIGHRVVGNGVPGRVTESLRHEYEAIVRGQRPRYASWLTPVTRVREDQAGA